MKNASIALGLAGLLFLPSYSGCSMQNAPVSASEIPKKSETLDRKIESEVYSLADELSRKMPEGFIREEFNNQFFYHDKTLKIEGGLPVEGSGRYVVTDKNGVVSLGSWTSGKEGVDIANLKSAFACYGIKDSVVILFIKHPLVIQYAKSGSSWERHVYDINELNANAKDAKPKEKTIVERKDFSNYLGLIERIRKTYPPKDRVQSKPELPRERV